MSTNYSIVAVAAKRLYQLLCLLVVQKIYLFDIFLSYYLLTTYMVRNYFRFLLHIRYPAVSAVLIRSLVSLNVLSLNYYIK